MRHTYVIRVEDKAGSFLKAARVIGSCGGNIVRTSYNRSVDSNTMFLEVAKHFEEGAKKYGENNWQNGIPVHCYIDSAVRHYLKWLRGDMDEPHDKAFVWNLMCCIWEVDYHENKIKNENVVGWDGDL